MKNTDLMRVYITVPNPELYSLIQRKEFADIINPVKRTIDEDRGSPSCSIYISEKPWDFYSTKEEIEISFNIRNVYDHRWETLFPCSLDEINPYLRFALFDKNISAWTYHNFEYALMDAQKAILEAYPDNGVSILKSRLCENEGFFYEHKRGLSVHNGQVIQYEYDSKQRIHEVADDDRIIDYTNRNLFTEFGPN